MKVDQFLGNHGLSTSLYMLALGHPLKNGNLPYYCSLLEGSRMVRRSTKRLHENHVSMTPPLGVRMHK